MNKKLDLEKFPHLHPSNQVSRRHFLTGTASTYFMAHAVMGFATNEAQAAIAGKGRGGFWSVTFVALMDTIVPGQYSDPTGAPGAVEAQTSEFCAALHASKVLPLNLRLIEWVVSAALNTMAFFTKGKGFHRCTLAHRTKLANTLSKISPVPLLYQLLRAPFYTGSMNRVGFDYTGYPGANDGYMDFSHGRVTWVPSPKTVGGNLP